MPSLSEETNGRVERLMPGATIGIIGGGQLGRMMALSARYMGFRIGVLDPTPDCPTAQVADFQVTAEYDDITAIRELAEKSDVLTYEFENVNADAINKVRSLAAAPQGTDLLRVTQDRVNEKQFINDHGTPTAPWKAVNSVEELDSALDEIHYPAVLKTRSGGYDGHGQTVLKSDADLERVRARANRGGDSAKHSQRLRRLRIRSKHSRCGQRRGVRDLPDRAQRASQQYSAHDHRSCRSQRSRGEGGTNSRCDWRRASNWRASPSNCSSPRMSGSSSTSLRLARVIPGHYTIEACSFDQFDAHIRGIAGWPLEQPELLKPAVMVNVLGQHVAPTRALIAEHPEWSMHDYCKAEVRHDRKMGHITVLTNDTKQTVAILSRPAAGMIEIKPRR